MKRSLFLAAALGLALNFPVAWGQGNDIQQLPENPPIPKERPSVSDDAVQPEPAKQAGMPPEERACRQNLRDLKVTFTEATPIDEPEGCEASWPIEVSQLPGEVELRPAAIMSCTLAEATARFVQSEAAPLSKRIFGSDLAAIDQVSSYVCRPRVGGSKLSEHAFANALDWGALEMEDGTTVDVKEYRRSEPRRARFIGTLMEAACGPFKTVLGPGSNADHADHFHFDMAERRNGGTWCK